MNYDAYRANKIESGLLYQDFIVDLLLQTLGLAVVVYSSRLYQMQVGESRTGVEIKHDELFAKTGNFWIEVGEKAQPREGDFAPSGILRGDNSWLYVIGNYDEVYGFQKTLLCGLHASGKYRQLENKTHTSIGFLLPKARAQVYAAFILEPKAERKVVKALQDMHDRGRELHQIATANPAQRSLFDMSEDES